MFKTLKLSAQSHPSIINQRNDPCEDLFKLLPDEILLKILSRMPLRDAAKTSLVSVRWKDLWKFNPMLTFNTPKYFREATSLAFMEEERKKYSTWVNKMLKSYEGAVIDGLIICFDLDNTYKSNLDSWIEFAVRKSAVVLQVDLLTRLYVNGIQYSANVYTFPKQVLCNSSIKVLRYLRLRCVDVSGPVLENIISMCPNLHLLGVISSSTLLGLKVSSPKLEFLEIRCCNNLKYLEISAGNLIKLTYYGPTSLLRLDHSPKLVTLSVGGWYCMDKFTLFHELSPCFPHIQNLELEYILRVDCEIPPPPPRELPEFKLVKHLDMRVHTEDEDSLLPFISLIKRCPMLHTLEVEFAWESGERSIRKFEERQGEELKCLKVLKFKRFDGRTADVELAISILENAPFLEKLIFDPWDSNSKPVGDDPASKPKAVPIWDLILDEKRKAARERARLLAKMYSPNAKLVLL